MNKMLTLFVLGSLCAACITACTPMPTDVINISTAAQLAGIQDKLDGKYRLTQNITVSAWLPIGNWESRFTGDFDGNGHTITINSFGAVPKIEGIYCYGLFGAIGGGKVSKLHVVRNPGAVNHNSGHIVYGGIAGFVVGGLIENCSVSGILSAETASTDIEIYVGGIAGLAANAATIRNCYASGSNVSATGGSGDRFAGGIVGYAAGEALIRGCVALQKFINGSDAESGRVVGNLVGASEIERSYANSAMLVNGFTRTEGVPKEGKNCTQSTTDSFGWGNPDFWHALEWDNTIWNFTGINTTVFPKLR